MKTIILSAGYGERFYTLTKNRAKSLLPLRNRPIIEHIVNKVQLLDEAEQIFIVTNHRFYKGLKAWVDNFVSPIPIKLIDDGSCNFQDRLGAVKDLSFVIERENITDDLLVIGGDNLFSFNINEFTAFAKSASPNNLIGLYDLNGRLRPDKFGMVKLDNTGKVIEFHEKPKHLNGSRLVSMCLYYFPREKALLIKEYLNEEKGLNTIGAYIEWLFRKDTVYGYRFEEGDWISIGDADAYTEAVCTF